jgi:hypothetical protein
MITGSETGNLSIFKLTVDENQKQILKFIYKLPKNWSFGEKVHRIKSFYQKEDENEESRILVAGCGDDNSVRIFSLSKNIFSI